MEEEGGGEGWLCECGWVGGVKEREEGEKGIGGGGEDG